MPTTTRKGLRATRLDDDLRFSAEENVFAKLWEKEVEKNPFLIEVACRSDRDFQVAATVIQWLGTQVGQKFLQNASDGIAQLNSSHKRLQQITEDEELCSVLTNEDILEILSRQLEKTVRPVVKAPKI